MPYRTLFVMLQSRAFGMQLPIKEHDVLHFFTNDGSVDGYLSGEFVIQAIMLHLTTGLLTEMVRRASNGEPPLRTMNAPTTHGVSLPPSKEDKAVLRERRRKPPRKMMLVLLALALTGCTHWIDAQGREASPRDLYECERDATFGTRSRDYDPLLKRQCLEARGYTSTFKK